MYITIRLYSWCRRWTLAILYWLRRLIGASIEHLEGPKTVTPKIAAAYEDVAPALLEVRRHMHNVKAAYPSAGGEELRRRALGILRQHGMAHRRAALAIELVMQEWM